LSPTKQNKNRVEKKDQDKIPGPVGPEIGLYAYKIGDSNVIRTIQVYSHCSSILSNEHIKEYSRIKEILDEIKNNENDPKYKKNSFKFRGFYFQIMEKEIQEIVIYGPLREEG
jgi:hypothetical protein